ncbi:MAG: peptidyl-prolyl cis-trans isomerase [Pseudonocardiales bacterium]|jgi:peptidyl-prolyl cis-trans isomerase B (cyclophilin B)|nr:peptidyl-prolyl cis-trans isomerase [Pseudonocardiales bacterium]
MPSSNQKREAARRQLQRQLERRQVQEARRRRSTLIVSIIGTIALVGLIVGFIVATGNDKKKTPVAAATSSPSTTPTTTASRIPGICDFLAAGTAARTVNPPSSAAATKGTVQVTVATNRGPMTFTLNRAAAPCTVANFVSLVKQKFYDKTPCHRLVTAGIYVLQCGDPTGKGSGGPGYSIPDEATGKETYPAGTIAMARTPQTAHSGGSQFFIVYKDSPALQQQLGTMQYTVFGKVTQGLGVVTAVAAKGSNNANGANDGAPKLPITLQTLKVQGSAA